MDALKAAAEAGDPRAMSDLGATYAVGGEGIEQSWEEAFRWFTAAARGGFPLANVNLAACYREGNGCAKDEAKALECYRSVADHPDHPEPDAMELLGEIYAEGDCGVERDPAEAARWFRRGADAGSVECAYRRAVCLATGAGVARDYAAAAEGFRAAAAAGHVGASLDLGHCLMNGLGVPEPEPFEATRAYAAAAEGGLSEGAYHLAVAYLNGRGVRAQARAAKRWLLVAAEAGHAVAMHELAQLYAAGGVGVERDLRAAVKWYERSAELGNAESAAALGSACVSGIGHVPADLDAAARWFEVAAERGVEEARLALADVEREKAVRSARDAILTAHDAAWERFVAEAEAAATRGDRTCTAAPVPRGETLDALVAARRGRETRERWVDFERERGGVFVEGALREILTEIAGVLELFPAPAPPKEKKEPTTKTTPVEPERRAKARDDVVAASPAGAKKPHPSPRRSNQPSPSQPRRRSTASPAKTAARANTTVVTQPRTKAEAAAKAREASGVEAQPRSKPAPPRPSEGGSGRSKKAVDPAKLNPSSPYAAAAPRRHRRV